MVDHKSPLKTKLRHLRALDSTNTIHAKATETILQENARYLSWIDSHLFFARQLIANSTPMARQWHGAHRPNRVATSGDDSRTITNNIMPRAVVLPFCLLVGPWTVFKEWRRPTRSNKRLSFKRFCEFDLHLH